jgi:hypothetical protein
MIATPLKDRPLCGVTAKAAQLLGVKTCRATQAADTDPHQKNWAHLPTRMRFLYVAAQSGRCLTHHLSHSTGPSIAMVLTTTSKSLASVQPSRLHLDGIEPGSIADIGNVQFDSVGSETSSSRSQPSFSIVMCSMATALTLASRLGRISYSLTQQRKIFHLRTN